MKTLRPGLRLTGLDCVPKRVEARSTREFTTRGFASEEVLVPERSYGRPFRDGALPRAVDLMSAATSSLAMGVDRLALARQTGAV
jgi:hypothetical protein